MVHLDTNFLIQALRAGSPEQNRLLIWWSQPNEDIGVSAVVWAEFLCGPLTSADEATARRFFPSPEALSAGDAEVAARLFNKTGRRSRSLADCMIAAVAVRCGAKLATINAPDFQPFAQYGLLLA
jgi:predicted nucleic acid-binding protein